MRTAYCVAKGGLEALTRAMAQELASKIRVNAIALGSFATDGLQGSLDLMPGSLEKMEEATPLHRPRRRRGPRRLCVYLSTRDATRPTRPSTSTAASTRTIAAADPDY